RQGLPTTRTTRGPVPHTGPRGGASPGERQTAGGAAEAVNDTTAAGAPDHREAQLLRVIGTVVGGATGDVPEASATQGGPERRSGIDRSNARGLPLVLSPGGLQRRPAGAHRAPAPLGRRRSARGRGSGAPRRSRQRRAWASSRW